MSEQEAKLYEIMGKMLKEAGLKQVLLSSRRRKDRGHRKDHTKI